MDATEQARIDHAAEDLARVAGYAMYLRADRDTRRSAIASAAYTLATAVDDNRVLLRALDFEGDGEPAYIDPTTLFPDRLGFDRAAAMLAVRAGLRALEMAGPTGRERLLDLMVEDDPDAAELVRRAGGAGLAAVLGGAT